MRSEIWLDDVVLVDGDGDFFDKRVIVVRFLNAATLVGGRWR